MNNEYVKIPKEIFQLKSDSKTKILAFIIYAISDSKQFVIDRELLAGTCGIDFSGIDLMNSLKKLERNGILKFATKGIQIHIEILNSEENDITADVINYLNKQTGKKFRASTRSTRGHINARIKEGYTFDDFCRVIDYKVQEWMGTEYEQFLRPNTLFSPSHFESYLNAVPNVSFKNNSDQMRLVRYFEDFMKEIDEKYRIQDRQSIALDFDRLLMRRHSANEIYFTMKKMFESNNPWMIKRYKDVKKFCKEFESIYIDLKIDFTDGG